MDNENQNQNKNQNLDISPEVEHNSCGRPIIPKGYHPVETGRYQIPTNEIKILFNNVSKWIENRSPGGIVFGRPRIGKTEAIKYLIKILKSKFGDTLPVFHILCDQHSKPNENVFFENLLRDVEHGLPLSGNASSKRDRLLKFFMFQCEMSANNRIILFIDDAQRLFEIQYGWLMDIYNILNKYDISMSVILVGQEELIHQKNAFIQSKKTQIVGRFMVQEYKFSGIKNIRDMSACLQGYDLSSEYPVKSGWSFTKYFFPDAFDSGKRLENCAEDLFMAFTNIRMESGFKKTFEIPMMYLTLTIDCALKKYGVNGANIEWLTCNHWKESIRNSGYIEAEMYQEII